MRLYLVHVILNESWDVYIILILVDCEQVLYVCLYPYDVFLNRSSFVAFFWASMGMHKL